MGMYGVQIHTYISLSRKDRIDIMTKSRDNRASAAKVSATSTAAGPAVGDLLRIRELETAAATDARNLNNIIDIQKLMADAGGKKQVRLGAMHALRRLFITFLEEGKLSAPTGDDEKLAKFRTWLLKQFKALQSVLLQIAAPPDDTADGAIDLELQVAAIRTIIEFVKREYLMHFNGAPQLGVGTLTALLSALALGPEMDADVLLLLRDEIFSKTDCLYHGLLIIRRIILSAKRGSNIESRPESFESDAEEASVAPPQSSSSALESVAKNALDMLRMTECLEEGDDRLDVSNCMVQNDDDKSAGGSDSESDASEGSDDEGTDKKVVAKSTRNERTGIRKRALEEEEKKTSNNRKSRKLEMLDARCHRKAFSRAWLALLAVPMTPSQHKIVLRHIPDLVMPHLDQPLLLADYLTRSYECGGVTAVLALESLFNVILKHNLDYPQFFRSLYRLCTVEVFSAKYRVKFMKLLNASLRSVNLTAYVVASFIKRLARVSLAAPSPVALFCLAQITWLLRRHPQCIRLIHKPTTGSARGSDSFKPEEEDDLEQTGALESSLWELDALRRHHFHAVATLASALDNESSTQSGAKEIPLNIDDFINQSYASLIESELKSTKKHSALSFSPGDFLPSQSDAAAGAALFLMAPATKEAEPFCKSLNMFA